MKQSKKPSLMKHLQSSNDYQHHIVPSVQDLSAPPTPAQHERPCELPSTLPVLSLLVATDNQLNDITPRAHSIIVDKEWHRACIAKQAAIAETLMRQCAKRQVKQMSMACRAAQIHAEKGIQRLKDQLRAHEAEATWLDQLCVHLEAGEVIKITPTEAKKVRRVAGFGDKKPHLTKEDHRLILELAGSKNQALIAKQVGTSQATISRHLHPCFHG